MPDDLRERDFFRRTTQAIAARDAAFALDDARGLEVIEDLFEETLRNILLAGDFLDAHDGIIFLVIASQNQQGAQGIFAAGRKLHWLQSRMYSRTVKF